MWDTWTVNSALKDWRKLWNISWKASLPIFTWWRETIKRENICLISFPNIIFHDSEELSLFIFQNKKSNLKLFLQFRQNEMFSLLSCIMIKVLLKWYPHCGGMPLSFGIENPFIMEIDRVSASCKQMYVKTDKSYASTYINMFSQLSAAVRSSNSTKDGEVSIGFQQNLHASTTSWISKNFQPNKHLTNDWVLLHLEKLVSVTFQEPSSLI